MIIKHRYIYPTDKPPSIYLMPPKTLIGKGCLNLCGTEFKKLGIQKSLIITDAFLAESGVASTISNHLREAGIDSQICTAVKPNPTFETAQEVLKVKEEDFDTMAGMALADNCFKSNVKTPAREDIIKIYRNAYRKIQRF